MSDTLCGMPYEDCDDCSTLWKEKRVKVRVAHVCEECRVAIPVGEECGKADSLYDGSWDTLYRCASCLILAELAATLTGECALWGGLSEYIANFEDYTGEDVLSDLPTPVQHRKLWESADSRPAI